MTEIDYKAAWEKADALLVVSEKTVRDQVDRIMTLQAESADLKGTIRRLEQDLRATSERHEFAQGRHVASQAMCDVLRRQIADLAGELDAANKKIKEQESRLEDIVPRREVFRVTGLPERFDEAAATALAVFAEGYREYGPGAADELGLAGQWGDLHRKVGKLKRPLWNGEDTLTRESEFDILNDIIGHCLLAIDMLNRGLEPGR